jgi:hypothetical protein
MGLFDSIGLGSVAKVLDVGGIVKNVVDGVLPHNLASVGDLAGAVVDFKTGNVAAAVQHAVETVRDLPQVARGAQPSAGISAANLNRLPPQLEPPPPPLASRQGKAFDWNDLLAAIKALSAALNRQGTPGTAAASRPANGTGAASTTPATTSGAATTTPATASGTASTTPATTFGAATRAATTTASTPGAASSPMPPPASNFAQAWGSVPAATAQHQTEHRTWWNGRPPAWTVGNQPWRGQPVAPAPANRSTAPANQAAPAATATVATATAVNDAAAAVKAAATAAKAAATAPAANTSPPATTATTAPKPDAPASAGVATAPSSTSAAEANKGKTGGQPSTGQTISSLAQLNGMSDAAIRDAVINGRISPDVLKDQGAMMVLQQRMNAISEMNNLMTSMMRALHDMQIAVIQNIRI